MSALITFQNVCKYYHMGDATVKAADHISFEICKGEFVAIVGSSGSGKSTCMNIIGCLDVPSEGTYLLQGRDVGQMNKNELAEIRNEMLGFIFQQYNLLPKLNLLENVEVPLMYAGVSKGERRERAHQALAQVGAVAILSLPENKGKLAFFGGIKNARFKRQVVPGDVLELRCELTRQVGSVGFGKAAAKVDGKLAARCELTFVIQ